MAKLLIHEDSIEVQLNLAEKIFAAAGDLRIPAANILGAYKFNGSLTFGIGWRFGTSIPGLFHAGRFFAPNIITFCIWARGQEPLALNLSAGPYRRVIIGVDDSQALADDINDRLTAC